MCTFFLNLGSLRRKPNDSSELSFVGRHQRILLPVRPHDGETLQKFDPARASERILESSERYDRSNAVHA